ncbi:MAG: malonate transporter [Massilia sp.]
MSDILAIISPIYIAILAGYAATRMGLFGKADMRVFGKFVINLALPALVFATLSAGLWLLQTHMRRGPARTFCTRVAATLPDMRPFHGPTP